MNATELTRPLIHSNGTSASALANDYGLARDALADALNALGRCYPHGRDYYHQPATQFTKAQEEHRIRMDKVRSAMFEIAELEMHCLDFGSK